MLPARGSESRKPVPISISAFAKALNVADLKRKATLLDGQIDGLQRMKFTDIESSGITEILLEIGSAQEFDGTRKVRKPAFCVEV